MQTLAALDLYFLLKELSFLEGAHLDKVYQPSKEELILQVHKEGKQLVRILVGKALFLSKTKSAGEQLTYAKFLRKHLSNSRMNIVQPNFERILEFHFSKGPEKKILIVELFSKGNIILTDKDYKIIAPFLKQKFKDRVIQANSDYVFPPSSHGDFSSITEMQLKKLFLDSDKESIVKTLAIDLALGGTYAEELCARADLDKNLKSLTDNQIKKLHSSIKEVRELPLSPCKSDNNIYPFNLVTKTCTSVSSFSEELEKIYTSESSSISKDQSKLENAIKKQESRLVELENEVVSEKEKAELIYHNYELVQKILSSPTDKLKSLSVVKDIDLKNKKVTIEI